MISLREGTPAKDGDCQFCREPNHHGTVYLIIGVQGLQVRFCLPCLLSAVQQIPAPKQGG